MFNCLKNYVKCQECGKLVARHYAQKIDWEFEDCYFCKEHKKPYEKVRRSYSNSCFLSTFIYYKEFEVDKKGNPIKKKLSSKGKRSNK